MSWALDRFVSDDAMRLYRELNPDFFVWLGR
jgi:hypothetical protein